MVAAKTHGRRSGVEGAEREFEAAFRGTTFLTAIQAAGVPRPVIEERDGSRVFVLTVLVDPEDPDERHQGSEAALVLETLLERERDPLAWDVPATVHYVDSGAWPARAFGRRAFDTRRGALAWLLAVEEFHGRDPGPAFGLPRRGDGGRALDAQTQRTAAAVTAEGVADETRRGAGRDLIGPAGVHILR